jgi:hypothetical protein
MINKTHDHLGSNEFSILLELQEYTRDAYAM